MQKIKPTKKQLEFLDWELGVFFHFGIRTFYQEHSDWDGLEMSPEKFNPKGLDCRQWIKCIKEAGARYAILTCKHHDGFANWPSKYTEYSVKNTPWKNGGGDVVREFTDACREYDIKVGLYYSPAQFGSQKLQGKEYDDYFINQISELLTDYGKIDYLWFDGCGSENHKYDTDRIVAAIRSLQPDILIFSMWDPDTRWVGNEEGIASVNMHYTVSDANTSILESEAKSLDKERFLPYECDCKIRRKSWFFKQADEKYLRDADDLMSLYYYSVGRGGNLLLNIGPDDRGLLPEPDTAVFKKFGNAVRERFANPISSKITREGDEYIITLDSEQHINHIVIEEDLSDGEAVNGFELTYFYYVDMVLFEGKTIGHKRICSFPSAFGDTFKLKITDASKEYKIKSISVYNI